MGVFLSRLCLSGVFFFFKLGLTKRPFFGFMYIYIYIYFFFEGGLLKLIQAIDAKADVFCSAGVFKVDAHDSIGVISCTTRSAMVRS